MKNYFDEDCCIDPTVERVFETNIQNTQNQKLNKVELFSYPTEIIGGTRKKIMKLLNQHSLVNMKIFLWNKIVDEDLHPNDYLILEDCPVFFQWILSPCQGIKNIELFILDKDIDIKNIKLKQAMSFFQKKYCMNYYNESSCNKMHYFIGTGDYKVDKKSFKGIHIIPYPDYHPDQEEYNPLRINDEIYIKYLVDPNPEPMEYVILYFKRLKKILELIKIEK